MIFNRIPPVIAAGIVLLVLAFVAVIIPRPTPTTGLCLNRGIEVGTPAYSDCLLERAGQEGGIRVLVSLQDEGSVTAAQSDFLRALDGTTVSDIRAAQGTPVVGLRADASALRVMFTLETVTRVIEDTTEGR